MADDLEQRRAARLRELTAAGKRQLALRQFAAAEETFRQALGLDPGSSALHNDLGVALRGQKRDREAMAEFDRAIQANPDSANARRNLFAAASTGAVGVAVFFVVIQALPEVEHQLPAPVADGIFLGSVVAAIAGLWIFGWYRRRSLSPQARAAYRREARRERNLELARGLFKGGPPFAAAIAMVLILAANPDASVWWFAAGALFIVVWLVTWKRLWAAVARSRVPPHQRWGG
jgi:tetratricopeptide (TPR) repeat protein